MTITTDPIELPAADAPWTAWRDYGLSWGWSRQWVLPQPTAPDTQPVTASRSLTVHAYQEDQPGRRWQALYDATWAGYRAWYATLGSATPTEAECRTALIEHMPELVDQWDRLSELTDDPLAPLMLSMWGLPKFAVGCSQIIVPGERPVVARNYDYDPLLFEGVIASTNWSGKRRVIGTSDLLWGLLDGMNEDGLVASLTFGGRQGAGEGFGIPLVIRYLLETCTEVDQAVEALRRIPIAQSYNIALADRSGRHATVFVAPGESAIVSDLTASTNHPLSTVERPEHAERFRSLERQNLLLSLDDDLVDAMLSSPLRSDEFDVGFGTLYTVVYEPGADSTESVATWHWPDASWTRRFDDRDEVRTVILAA